MRLIACPCCHSQYDVSEVLEAKISCRCGEVLENRELEAVESQIHRCGSCGAHTTPEASGCEFCGATIVRDKRKLSLICPECYARNSSEARFCAACGVGFEPERIEATGVDLPCPSCRCMMPVRLVGGVATNECTECNGIWVPGGKFDVLVDRAIEARKANMETPSLRRKGGNPMQEKVRYRKCPECKAMMQRRNFRKVSGIIIDTCVEHGTWLDADELEAIAGFISSGGRPAAEQFVKDQKAANQARERTPAPVIQRYAMPTYEEAIHGRRNGTFSLLNLIIRLLG